MKLGELRGAIRKYKGNPYVNLFPFPGSDKGFRIYAQKTPLLEELERVYPGGKSTETGLEFVPETGLLRSVEYDKSVGLNDQQKAMAFEGASAKPDDDDLLDLDEIPAPAPAANSADLDDLLV